MAVRRARCPQCSQVMEYGEGVGQQIVCPKCKATLAVPKAPQAGQKADPLIGQPLGDYEVLSLLGRGGMGTVYKARQVSLDRPVALKVICTSEADPSFITRFEREARLAAAIHHPNIIQIYAVGRERDYQFIAMEFVDGESLGQVLGREGRLDATRVLPLMRQTCAALAKAHGSGILHRDIKPSNILLTRDGYVKVADFGLAKRQEGDVAATMAGTVVGSALYMAPEVAAGKPADARSDLYSLGATFYCLLAGEAPFPGTSITEVAIKHAQETVPPLADRAPGAPVALCRLIHRLLRKTPGERYPSADEVLTALDRVERALVAPGEDTGSSEHAAHHPPHAERLEARQQRQRKAVLIAATGMAAVALVIVLLAVLSPGKREPGDGKAGRNVAVAPSSADPVMPAPKVAAGTPSGKAPTSAAAVAKATPKAASPADALKETEQRVQGLLKQERFGDAAREYNALAARTNDPAARAECQKRVSQIESDAEAAYRKAEQQARQLAGQDNYSKARSVVRAVLETYGTETQTKKARDLLAELELLEATQAESPKSKKGVTKEEAEKLAKAEAGKQAKEEAAQKAEEENARALNARYVAGIQAVETAIREWDYTKATAALASLSFDDKRLAERLTTRRVELDLLAKLKSRMIDKINTAHPPQRKSTLQIPGINGDITGADERQITISLGRDVEEGHLWKKLSARSARLCAQMVVDRTKPDDLLASALLALVCDDVATAEKEFEEARALGAAVDRHLASLAESSLARVLTLVEKQSFPEAADALAALEEKYADSPLLATQKATIDAARATIKPHVAEAAAEKLYKQAVDLYKQKDFAELKSVVETLTEEYGDTKVFTDADRKPSVAEMAKATEKLGKIVTVSRTGKGDYKTIQAAIDAAEPNTVIVITEPGFYPDRIFVPQGKKGITIKAKKHAWPFIGYDPNSKRVFSRVADVEAPDVTFEGLVFMVKTADTSSTGFIGVKGGHTLRLRSCIFYSSYQYSSQIIENYGGSVDADNCLFLRGGTIYASLQARNSICMGRYLYAYSSTASRVGVVRVGEAEQPRAPEAACKLENCLFYRFESSRPVEMDFCTIPAGVELRGAPNAVTNSIMEQINATGGETAVDYCCVYGKQPFVDFAKPGKRCFNAQPQFVNPRNFDYRLQRSSPCFKKASDGGAIGCRLTRDMVELLVFAFEMRRRGLFDFVAPVGGYDYGPSYGGSVLW